MIDNMLEQGVAIVRLLRLDFYLCINDCHLMLMSNAFSIALRQSAKVRLGNAVCREFSVVIAPIKK